jgi:hypothetical protein
MVAQGRGVRLRRRLTGTVVAAAVVVAAATTLSWGLTGSGNGRAVDPVSQPSSAPSPTGEVDANPPASGGVSLLEPSTVTKVDNFLGFANKRGTGKPSAAVTWASEVAYSITGEPVATLDGNNEANNREAWQGCPPAQQPGGTYEGRDCPVSPLDTIADYETKTRGVNFAGVPPDVVGCNNYNPPVAANTTVVFIQPSKGDCFTDFVVAVIINNNGRITGVDLTLSGP